MTTEPTSTALTIDESVRLTGRIHEAKPEKEWYTRVCNGCGKEMALMEDCVCEDAPVSIYVEPIRLADVLLASTGHSQRPQSDGWFHET